MKVFRKNKFIRIHFSDGKTYTNNKCTDELWAYIGSNFNDEKKVRKYLLKDDGTPLFKRVQGSSVLTLKGASVYMSDVSEITMPQDLVLKILEAEDNNDTKEIQKYRNFWRLVSMNPDSRVRNNIFWFLKKWHIKLSESGFIIAYRNADIKKETLYNTEETKQIINTYYREKYINNNNPAYIPFKDKNLEEAYNSIVNGNSSPVYTDHHSHSFNITLGKPVSMPREDTDSCQEHTCSKGLHCASKDWLQQNYFGSVGMQVLVNPANIVAVPPEDSYGKLRTCEYFPVCLVDFDKNGNIIEPEYSLYNDIEYLKALKYEGTINNEDLNPYTLVETKNLSREDIYDTILNSLNA